jgi:hypothetical protein
VRETNVAISKQTVSMPERITSAVTWSMAARVLAAGSIVSAITASSEGPLEGMRDGRHDS